MIPYGERPDPIHNNHNPYYIHYFIFFPPKFTQLPKGGIINGSPVRLEKKEKRKKKWLRNKNKYKNNPKLEDPNHPKRERKKKKKKNCRRESFSFLPCTLFWIFILLTGTLRFFRDRRSKNSSPKRCLSLLVCRSNSDDLLILGDSIMESSCCPNRPPASSGNTKLFRSLRRRSARFPFGSMCGSRTAVCSRLLLRIAPCLHGFSGVWTRKMASNPLARPTRIPATSSHALDPAIRPDEIY